jgi:hypothetical protein
MEFEKNVSDLLARNNLTPAMLAAAAGVSERTVANWRHCLPAEAAAALVEIEAAKRAAGEWPVAGLPQTERLRERRRKLAASARAKATPEDLARGGRNAAAARVANKKF